MDAAGTAALEGATAFETAEGTPAFGTVPGAAAEDATGFGSALAAGRESAAVAVEAFTGDAATAPAAAGATGFGTGAPGFTAAAGRGMAPARGATLGGAGIMLTKGAPSAERASVTTPSAFTGTTVPHLRHFILTVRPATFSSASWYFAWQLGQENFMGESGARAFRPYGSRGSRG